MLRKSHVGLALCSCLLGWTGRGSAETEVHLGLETSLYSNTSVEGTSVVSGVGGSSSSTEVKVSQTTSEFGLPGSSSLTFGVLFGDHFDLGTRFGYVSRTNNSDSSGSKVENSTFSLAPYLAYLTGAHGDVARVAFGLTAGLGSGSVKTTTQSTGGTSATSSAEVSVDSKSYGAFFGLHGFASDTVSIDPMLMVMSTSATSSGNVDLSGLTFMLSVGLSLWTGGSSTMTTPLPSHSASSDASNGPTGDNTEDAGAKVVPKPRSGSVTLKFGQERTITFVRNIKSDEPLVFVLVRDPGQEEVLKACNQLTLHAVNQKDTQLDAAPGTASSQSMRFTVLKAAVYVEDLRAMGAAPIANNASAPEHWIDVCDQRWKVAEEERSHLKEFIDALPSPSATPAPVPATDVERNSR